MAKHFENPYPDYNQQIASKFLENGLIKKDCNLLGRIEEKWRTTQQQLQNLEYRDYSVYTGTAGVALLYLKRFGETAENLKIVEKLLQLNKLKGRRHTFLCGDAGPLAIGAVIEHKRGNLPNCNKLIKSLLAMEGDVLNINSDLPNEYLYGRAGYLFALLYINKNTSQQLIEEAFIRKVIETILICGKNESKAGHFKCPLMYQWHESYYLGAAHGLSGILYLLLQIRELLTETELNTLIQPTVDYLNTIRYSSGNFPSSMGRDNDKYVQWCHGAPGFVYLFTAAFKVFGDAKYLQWALECGDVVWKRGLLKKGYSICHGVSGNAYCFLELYQTTKDEKHLYRAVRFAEWCLDYRCDHEQHPPDRPLSLYEGICGPTYFLLDLINPNGAKFPGFTL